MLSQSIEAPTGSGCGEVFHSRGEAASGGVGLDRVAFFLTRGFGKAQSCSHGGAGVDGLGEMAGFEEFAMRGQF